MRLGARTACREVLYPTAARLFFGACICIFSRLALALATIDETDARVRRLAEVLRSGDVQRPNPSHFRVVVKAIPPWTVAVHLAPPPVPAHTSLDGPHSSRAHGVHISPSTGSLGRHASWLSRSVKVVHEMSIE